MQKTHTWFWDTESLDGWIIDPGCYEAYGKAEMLAYTRKSIKPVRLLNTHCHLDHVFGNAFVFETWGLKPQCHLGELPVLERLPQVAQMYGIPMVQPSPTPEVFLADHEVLHLGQFAFECVFAPGHSPASLCFYCAEEQLLIGGDVLFLESIGRTDLPGGNHQTLIDSIKTRIFTLPEATIILPGHGPETSIRHEIAIILLYNTCFAKFYLFLPESRNIRA